MKYLLKHFFSFLVCFTFLFFIFCKDKSTNPIERELLLSSNEKITSGNFDRTFRVYIPTNVDTSKLLPVVFCFHGAGDNSYNFELNTNFDKISNDLGFLMVYPNSIGQNWAEGIGASADQMGIDDVGFTQDMIDYLKSYLKIDEKRIFVLGFSQGGLFTHHLVSEIPEKITAYATIASSMSVIVSNKFISPTQIPVLMIHGTHDEAFPWAGEKNGIFSVLSQQDILQKMLFNNNCNQTPTTIELPNTVSDGRSVVKDIYKNNNNEEVVEFYTIKNGHHEWPLGDIDPAEEILNFFSRFTKKRD